MAIEATDVIGGFEITLPPQIFHHWPIACTMAFSTHQSFSSHNRITG
jgi:hypothetical protein